MVAAVALSSNARATSFTMTTETGDSFGFIDTDTMSLSGEIGKAVVYMVMKSDLAVPASMKFGKYATKYAVSAAEVWFQCKTKNYIAVKLFLYDAQGQFVGSLDKPVLGEQPIPPQTGTEEQYNYVCNVAAVRSRINQFNEYETPLQTLIRVSRATFNDPRYVP